MKIKAIFFDLDGTLLPMDQDTFIAAYLSGLVKILAPKGYDPKLIKDALWQSTAAMMKNDGSASNEDVFWDNFAALLGEDIRNEGALLEEFYKTDFQKISRVCGYEPRARELIKSLKSKGIPLILATSPLFPTIATESRIRWAGLDPEDFDYITTFENSRYCKPNPIYYSDLLDKTGYAAEECLMIGNDVGDDMVANTVRMNVYLVTNDLINRRNIDITIFEHGSFDELCNYLENLYD